MHHQRNSSTLFFTSLMWRKVTAFRAPRSRPVRTSPSTSLLLWVNMFAFFRTLRSSLARCLICSVLFRVPVFLCCFLCVFRPVGCKDPYCRALPRFFFLCFSPHMSLSPFLHYFAAALACTAPPAALSSARVHSVLLCHLVVHLRCRGWHVALLELGVVGAHTDCVFRLVWVHSYLCTRA
jgi:hypothetical protein